MAVSAHIVPPVPALQDVVLRMDIKTANRLLSTLVRTNRTNHANQGHGEIVDALMEILPLDPGTPAQTYLL